MTATGEVTGETQQPQCIPQAPQGVPEAVWRDVIATRPVLDNNQVMAPQNWVRVLAILQENPSEKILRYFNQEFPGFDGAALLKKLGGAPETKSGDTITGTVPVAAEPSRPLWQRLPQTLLPPELRSGPAS